MMQSDTEPKFCKDCKHYSLEWAQHRCGFVRDPISGGPGAFADIERKGAGHRTGCGSDGRRFEPKDVATRGFWAALFFR